MRWIRGPVNAVLLLTLVKPIASWMIARWRRRVHDYAEETIVLPAQELLESALPPGVALTDLGLVPTDAEVIDALDERSRLRAVLIVGAVAALAIAIATILALVSLRRRRHATETQEPVAVPVEVPTHDPEGTISAEEELLRTEA